jgi:hypothetical protein
MDAGQWEAAAASLDALPVPERAPEDLIARATIQLVQGDIAGALDILRPATDPDQIASNVYLHPDRWENNTAAWEYYSLVDDIAERKVGFDDASLLTMKDSQSIYVMQPEIPLAHERVLLVIATYSNARPRNAYPIQTWRILVVSPDSTTKYAEVDVPAQFVDGELVRVATEVRLPDDIPELTEAVVIIEPRYNDAITTTPAIVPVVLNRPEAAVIPAAATSSDWHFTNEAGGDITLQAYSVERDANRLDLNLYWQTDRPLAENYQIFVHVVDADGQQVGGGDGAPVNNRYPTSQWETGETIFDPHTITFDSPLPPREYSVRIGLYRLPGGERLSVTSADERVQDNSVTIHQFQITSE